MAFGEKPGAGVGGGYCTEHLHRAHRTWTWLPHSNTTPHALREQKSNLLFTLFVGNAEVLHKQPLTTPSSPRPPHRRPPTSRSGCGGASSAQRPHLSPGEAGARLLLWLRFFPKRKAPNCTVAALISVGVHRASRGVPPLVPTTA